jgi:hypothetical protein
MRAFVAWVVAAVVLGSGAFDPSRDLPEFDACAFSPYADLYQLDRFESLSGKTLTSVERDEILAAWKEEKERVHAEIDRIQKDPKARFAWDLGRQAKRQPYLSTVPFDSRTKDEVVTFVQRVPKSPPNRAERIENEFAGEIEALARFFRDTQATPFGLERRKDAPAIALFVLASRGALDDFARTLFENPLPESCVAYFDPTTHLIVTYDPVGAKTVSDVERRKRLLREAVFAILDAHAAGGLGAIKQPWFVDGLATYLGSTPRKMADGSLAFGDLDADVARHCAAMVRDEKRGADLFPAIADVIRATSPEDVIALARARVGDVAGPVASNIHHDACHLLVRFLEEGKGGAYRSAFGQFLKAQLAGTGGPDGFREALGATDWREFEKEFRASVDAIAAKEGVSSNLASSPVAPPSPSAPSGAPGSAAPSPPMPPIVVPPPSALLAAASVLRRAKDGDVPGAVEAARAGGSDPDDVAFLEALAKLEDDVLEAERKADRNLPVKGPPAAVGKVKRFDAKEIVLADEKGKETVVPRSAFSPEQVRDRIRAKQLSVGTPDLLASLAAFVGKPADAAKIAGANASLVASRTARWSAMQREIDASERLGRLAPAVAELPASGDAALADLDALFGPLRDVEAAKANRAVLLALGRRLLEREFAKSDACLKALGGGAKRLADGRIEVSFAFDSADSLKAFVEDPRRAAEILGSNYLPKDVLHAVASARTGGGKLRLDGLEGVFFPVEFSTPFSAEFDMVYLPRDVNRENSVLFNAVALDDRRGVHFDFNWVSAWRRLPGSGEYYSTDPEQKGDRDFDRGRPYRIVFQHDGKEFSLAVDGKSKGRAADATTRTGQFGFAVSVDGGFEVSKLVLRGALAPTALGPQRAAWVAARVAKWESGAAK